MNFHKLLTGYLNSGYHFNTNEKLLKFQFISFNLILILAAAIASVAAIAHQHINTFLLFNDIFFAIGSFLLILLLRMKKNNYYLASKFFVLYLFFTLTCVFFLSGDEPVKIILTPILFACSFILLSSKAGLLYLTATLGSYFIAYLFLDQDRLGYTWQELLFISLAFIFISIIFNALKQKNDSDNKALIKLNAEIQDSKKEFKELNSTLKQGINISLIENQNKTKSIQRHLDIINKHIMTAHIDLHGLITNISEAYCKVSGYKKKRFLSQPFTFLFDQYTDVQILKNIWSSLQKETAYTSEIRNISSSNQHYWLDIKISPEYTQDGEHIGYIVIANNITDKKLVIQQQEQLLSQSRHAAMGEMISMIAHQWKQPLSTISAITTNIFLDINLNDYTSKSIEQQIQKIDKQTQHLSSTIEDFRNFFKPTKGLKNTYVHDLVKESVKLLEHRLKFIKIEYKNKTDILLAMYRN